ncbi:hypothetical protein AC579_5450 [Pseudocercospora musae]|uniref:Uncharacterized protein n=1 Tax=Pseudocercospora musae TaxID=113226 RepID=A0A139HJR6_9PEZI|nr:hypothetical protein AC579_5450 [Pseudocercospora musae]
MCLCHCRRRTESLNGWAMVGLGETGEVPVLSMLNEFSLMPRLKQGFWVGRGSSNFSWSIQLGVGVRCRPSSACITIPEEPGSACIHVVGHRIQQVVYPASQPRHATSAALPPQVPISITSIAFVTSQSRPYTLGTRAELHDTVHISAIVQNNMAQYLPDEALFKGLKDKVVVLTGGATGIGAATTRILASHGAKVVFGDINVATAELLAKELDSVTFFRCDVVKYDDLYNLFKAAHDQYGRVDHAISCAGIFEQGNWYDPKLTIDSVKADRGNSRVLDVNVLGTLHFSRIAAVFLREKLQKGGNRSLTLLSSVNAFRESPGLFIYQTSKHAIHGVLRSSRKTLYERDGIRVNAVCPGVTDTAMTAGIIAAFRDNNLYWQSAESVAKIIVGIMSETMNGKAYYIEGGDGWEFEDSFYAMQSKLLGEEPTRRMRANAEAVNKVRSIAVVTGDAPISILTHSPRVSWRRKSDEGAIKVNIILRRTYLRRGRTQMTHLVTPIQLFRTPPPPLPPESPSPPRRAITLDTSAGHTRSSFDDKPQAWAWTWSFKSLQSCEVSWHCFMYAQGSGCDICEQSSRQRLVRRSARICTSSVG